MYRDTLEARKRVLGEDHPDTLMSMNNVAYTLQSQGGYLSLRFSRCCSELKAFNSPPF